MNMVTSSPGVAGDSPVTLVGEVARDSGARTRGETGLLLSSVAITIGSEVWVGPKVLGQKPQGLSQSWFYFLQVCVLYPSHLSRFWAVPAQGTQDRVQNSRQLLTSNPKSAKQ